MGLDPGEVGAETPRPRRTRFSVKGWRGRVSVTAARRASALAQALDRAGVPRIPGTGVSPCPRSSRPLSQKLRAERPTQRPGQVEPLGFLGAALDAWTSRSALLTLEEGPPLLGSDNS